MNRVWTVLNADDDTARQAVRDAGCTHAVITANWNAIQPDSADSADSAALAAVVAAFDHARSIGLKVLMSINVHYAPDWVLSAVEPFRDQLGNDYTSTSSGKAVRNWMWTQSGRGCVAAFLGYVADALGPDRVADTDGARLGGGWYGEMHYPQAVSGGPTYAWQGFGPSMQTGTDLADGMDVCPLPGYVPYTGTDDQDCQWLNWYLNGIIRFELWLIAQHKALGFTRNLHLLLPGYGVRTNQARSSAGYKQAAALGEDHIRAVGAIMHDPAVWPYSTWLNTSDGFPGGVADSDKSAWKSIFEKALLRGKAANMLGENTGNESDAGMDAIFAGALGSAPYAGSLPGQPAQGYYFRGSAWLNYASLTDGTHATLAHYSDSIAAL